MQEVGKVILFFLREGKFASRAQIRRVIKRYSRHSKFEIFLLCEPETFKTLVLLAL
jgi:HSP90 family molecular chaperone